jgi:DNA (cytosine-5)-methyltransferase 1
MIKKASQSIRPVSTVKKKMNKKKSSSFKFIDLFAGIGGMRLGLEDAGGECIFSSEWDRYAQKTYIANFEDEPFGDITTLNIADLPDFDVLSAGFPCQPFSSFGKRAGFKHKTQGTLFFNVLDIIEQKRPSAFLLENVKGLLSHDNRRTIEVIEGALDEADYWVFRKVLNAADYGVPQNRERVYIVGFDKRKFKVIPNFTFPKAQKNKVGIGKFIESNVTGYSISEHLQKVYIFKKNDGKPEIVTPDHDAPVKTLVASYHKIQRMSGTFVKDGPTGLRLLTSIECKAVMGFPPKFKIPVSRTQMYRQLGNSVAVPVIKAVAREMASTIEQNQQADIKKRKGSR